MVILGISIGTRTSGIAILKSGRLVAWNTISFKNEWSERKAEKIVSKYDSYLKKHKVTLLVLKIPPLTHQSEALLSLLKKLQKIISYHGCMVEYKTKQEIKHALPEIRNTKQLMNHVVSLYPVLTPEYQQELANRNSYHAKMFEAVLVAHQGKELLHKKAHETMSHSP
jgi:RNase H-fold protein (predicted Holliday junction resolvase)